MSLLNFIWPLITLLHVLSKLFTFKIIMKLEQNHIKNVLQQTVSITLIKKRYFFKFEKYVYTQYFNRFQTDFLKT